MGPILSDGYRIQEHKIRVKKHEDSNLRPQKSSGICAWARMDGTMTGNPILRNTSQCNADKESDVPPVRELKYQGIQLL